jgi:FtsP/CotA-like multicopper oxidase with cupredoxin domain
MRYLMPLSLLMSPLSLLACGGDHGGHGDHGDLPPAPAMISPESWSGALMTPAFVDENPDPAIVEVSLRASLSEVEYLPGKRTQVWAYNGSVPGPTLEAQVGDLVIVHFTNDLPEATTIHWHGLRVPNSMDGAPSAMAPIEPGGSFDFEFTVPDAGTFWYHPHVRSDVQVEKGLYGAIVVRDPAEPAIPAAVEEIVILDDVLLDEATGALDDSIDMRVAMMGREGNLVLVNGMRSNLGVPVRAGEMRRWRMINAANARYFDVTVVNGSMIRIGGDGGLIEAPRSEAGIRLTPGERADVLVWADQPDTTATLRAVPYERAKGAGATEAVDIVRLEAGGDPALEPGELPAILRTIAATDAPAATRTIRLGERMEGDSVVFTINDAAFPDIPMLTTSAGRTETWEIVNESEMDHPFHIHGFFFQREGEREWKDTINIPASDTLRLHIAFDDRDGATGMWMYHCHILEHGESGMLAEIHVE